MSEVIRDTSCPAGIRSKNRGGIARMWVKTRSRRSRTKRSPIRPTRLVCTRISTSAETAMPR